MFLAKGESGTHKKPMIRFALLSSSFSSVRSRRLLVPKYLRAFLETPNLSSDHFLHKLHNSEDLTRLKTLCARVSYCGLPLLKFEIYREGIRFPVNLYIIDGGWLKLKAGLNRSDFNAVGLRTQAVYTIGQRDQYIITSNTSLDC